MGSKKKWIKYILLALLIALAAECIFHPVEAKADFGDFSGDTDFGGAGGGGFGGGDGSSRLTAYILDDRTGKVISGSRNKEKFMEYEWDVCRKSGVITGSAGMQSVSCPKCGAPLNINQTAKCPYCGSIVTLVNEDWALNNIKGVSQQTV